MRKILDGRWIESSVLPGAFDVRIFEVNGHRETSVRDVVVWSDAGPVKQNLLDNLLKWPEKTLKEVEDARLRSLRKSAQRAKQMCRRVIKAEGFNELLTLTTRDNQNDRELCKRQFKEWVRRMKAALSGFRYCAAFERQERGAMHVHLATHRLPEHAEYKGVRVKAWELGTRIWRDIVGLYPMHGPLRPGEVFPEVTNGLCFVGGKPRFAGDKRRRNMSIGKMAAYVSKYILKDFEDYPAEKNRYSRSNGTVLPKAKCMRYYGMPGLAEMIRLCFDLPEGHSVVAATVGRFKDCYWLVTEPPPPPVCAISNGHS